MSWQPHPQQPGFYYNAQTGQVAHHTQLGMPAPGAPPAQYAPPQQAPQYAPTMPAQPPAYGQPQGYGAPQPYGLPAPVMPGQPPAQTHGQFGQGQLAHASKPMPQFVEAPSTALPQAGFSRGPGGEIIYVDFPTLTQAGQSASLLVRFLPALSENDRFVTLLEHKMPIEFEVAFLQPGQQRKQSSKRSFYVVCPDFGTGPGNCTICAVRKNLQGDALERFKGNFWARKRVRHQVLNLSDPNVHWVQAKDDHGNPKLDAYGQPLWTIMPGVFSMGSDLYTSLTNASKNAPGAIDSRDRGVVMMLSKTKTGNGMTEVSYYAERGQELPLLGSQFEPVLQNIFALRQRFERYRSADEMTKLAELVKQKLGVSGPSYSMPTQGPIGYGPSPSAFGPGVPAGAMGMPHGMPMPTPGMPAPMAAPAAPTYAPQPQGYAPQQPPQFQAPQFQAPAPQGAPGGLQPPQFAPQAPAPQVGGMTPQQPPQQYSPTPPPPVSPAQLPHVSPMGGALPPPTAPGLAHAQLPPQAAAYGAQQPQQQPQQPQGYGAPQQPAQYAPQPQQPQAAPLTPEQLERQVTPSGGVIPF